MRRECRDLHHERLLLPHRSVDEVDALAIEDIGQIILRLVAVPHDVPILVERVVVFGVTVSGDVPLAPSGLYRVLRLVSVQILAHHRGPIARGLQRRREGGVLVALRVERLVAAVVTLVGEDPGVVRVLPGEHRRPRRAAQRVRHVVVRERHSPLPHLLDVRHVGEQVHRQVVGQHEHDVRPAGLVRRRGRFHPVGRLRRTGRERQYARGRQRGEFPLPMAVHQAPSAEETVRPAAWFGKLGSP